MNKIYFIVLKKGEEKPERHYFETEDKAEEWKDKWVQRNKYSKAGYAMFGPIPTVHRDCVTFEE